MIFLQAIPTQLLGTFDFASFIKMVIYGLIIITIITTIIIVIRNKLKYAYYGFVFKKRQNDPITGNPTGIMVSGKAGYFKKRSGKTVFRIKYGKAPWMKIETSRLPDPENMIGNTAFFNQIQKDNYVQARVDIDWNKDGITIHPVEDDTKFGAYLEMEEVRRILDQSKLTPFTIGLIIMGIIIVTGVVVFYFLSQAGGG